MSSSQETTASPPPEHQSTPPESVNMSNTDDSQTPPAAAENLLQKMQNLKMSSSYSIWPPTQRTRDAVINRLIETLSTPSVLSKRYGTIPEEEAAATARAIEEEAFNFAAASGAAGESIDEGIEILQVYSKEISKRMLDAVKSRATPTAEASSAPSNADGAAASVAATSEEASSVDNESN